GDLALLLAPFDGAVRGQCHTRRVVTAVLQPLQARDHDVEGFTVSEVSNDSTHVEKGTAGDVNSHPRPRGRPRTAAATRGVPPRDRRRVPGSRALPRRAGSTARGPPCQGRRGAPGP